MRPSPVSPTPDPRLILRAEEIDAALELFILAEAALWSEADAALCARTGELGRPHYRAALLLKRRPGLGVKDLARLLGLSKQGASRVLKELRDAGLADVRAGEEDARRRPARLTAEGAAFEGAVSERLRAHLVRAYRDGGLEHVPGALRILQALAGSRAPRRGEA